MTETINRFILPKKMGSHLFVCVIFIVAVVVVVVVVVVVGVEQTRRATYVEVRIPALRGRTSPISLFASLYRIPRFSTDQ